MENDRSAFSVREKQNLLKKILEKKSGGPELSAKSAKTDDAAGATREPPEDTWVIEKFPAYQQLVLHRTLAKHAQVESPFFSLHDGLAGAFTTIGGKQYLNFATYNYLGLNGDPRVVQAAKDAIDQYGVSASASRIVSGERPPHRKLEQALADMHGTEDAIAYVSGHATNVSTIGCLFGPEDLILHDRLAHNSIVQGARLSGAVRISFRHNDVDALENLLKEHRSRHEKTLIVVEGIYSMDGDTSPIPRLIEIKKRYKALLMVDEAHSIGVLGKQGRGVREHFGIQGADIDIWMGTLSKTLSGCGGYIAGSKALIEMLKFTSPGFVYSVGMPPVLAAASLAAIEAMYNTPERLESLRNNGHIFLEEARRQSLNVGLSEGYNIVPVITGRSTWAAKLSNALLQRGINAAPIIYPAVEERAARVRFFLSSEHTPDQIRFAVAETAAALSEIQTSE